MSNINYLCDNLLKHCFGFVDPKQYTSIGCASVRLYNLYPDTTTTDGAGNNDTTTSIDSATISISCAKLFLADIDIATITHRVEKVCKSAARYGRVVIVD